MGPHTPLVKYLTRKEAAEAMGMSVSSLKRWLRRGWLILPRYTDEAGNLRFLRADVLQARERRFRLEVVPRSTVVVDRLFVARLADEIMAPKKKAAHGGAAEETGRSGAIVAFERPAVKEA